MPLQLTSDAFANGQSIPAKYSCAGKNISPALTWTEPPAGTGSFALIVDDPDAPMGTWVHWVLYNIPHTAIGLATAATAGELPDGTREGLNDWKRTGYGGPCPPIGRHRYFHKLYALNTTLPDLGKPTKAQLEKAMADHVLAKAELIGTYQKGK